MNIFKYGIAKSKNSRGKNNTLSSKNNDNSLRYYFSLKKSEIQKNEFDTIKKSHFDSEIEFKRAITLFELNLESIFELFTYSRVVFLPPKYELIEFIILASLISKYVPVQFYFHKWTKNYIKVFADLTRRPDLNLEFLPITKLKLLDCNNLHDCKILNFYQKIYSIKYSMVDDYLVLFRDQSDIDFFLEFIFVNAFTFLGLKKLSLNKIVYTKEIKNKFLKKIQKRILFLEPSQSRMISQTLLTQFHELVSEGIAEGAELLKGDRISMQGGILDKVVFKDIDPRQRLFQKRLYGPIITLTEMESNAALDSIFHASRCKAVLVCENETDFNQLTQSHPEIKFINIPKPNINSKISKSDKIISYDINLLIRVFLENLDSRI